MIPAGFAYSRPTTIDQALKEIGNGSKVIAGGQSLLPLLKLRLASVEKLVDIGRVPGLRGVRELADGRLAVGALTTYRELLDSPARNLALISDAVPDIGDVQVRNRGTVGGAIAHADPASDLPAVLIALEAEIVVRSSRGEKAIPAEKFFVGAFQTALKPKEIVTEIRLPAPRDDAGSAYRKIEQKASGYSIAGVAVVVVRGGDGKLADIRVGVTGVSAVAYRATGVEKALRGTDGSATAIAAAARRVTDGKEINSDIHADAEYRTAMAAVLTRRAIEAALARI
ncbi:MAG TPA: xanthine dehydrogenase family protein subunit M [Candidatus Limnocylindrales bacterium]|jgi:carbon-monoxide dehydrogenase medium subunit